MNPRDIPEVVAELIYEMHEVRSELTALNGRVDRLEQALETGLIKLEQSLETGLIQLGQRLGQRFEDSMQQNTDRLIEAFSQSMGQHLTYLDKHDQQLKNHAGRLNTLENPTA